MVPFPPTQTFFTKSGRGSFGYVGVATIHILTSGRCGSYVGLPSSDQDVWNLCTLCCGSPFPATLLCWCWTINIWWYLDILWRCRKGFFLFSALHEKILATLAFYRLSVWNMDISPSAGCRFGLIFDLSCWKMNFL